MFSDWLASSLQFLFKIKVGGRLTTEHELESLPASTSQFVISFYHPVNHTGSPQDHQTLSSPFLKICKIHPYAMFQTNINTQTANTIFCS